MNTKEIQTEVNAIIANCSPEVQETVNQIIEKILIEIDTKDQIRDNEKVAKEPAPEPSLIVKHILDIKSVQANPQRNYEIYFMGADEDITAEDIRESFEANPQNMVDVIRERGKCFYSRRNTEKRVIV